MRKKSYSVEQWLSSRFGKARTVYKIVGKDMFDGYGIDRDEWNWPYVYFEDTDKALVVEVQKQLNKAYK